MKRFMTIGIWAVLALIAVLAISPVAASAKPADMAQYMTASLVGIGVFGFIFTERNHVIAGIYPVADFLAGTVYSDVYSMKNAQHITFFVMKGAGGTGTSLITIEACSTAAAAAQTAVAFRYKKCSSSTSEDTFGDVTEVAATGLTTAAAANEIYAIEVDAQDLASTGYEFVRLKAVEQANDPVTGVLFAILSNLKQEGATLPEAIS